VREQPAAPIRSTRRRKIGGLLAGAFAIKAIVLIQMAGHPLTQPDAGLDTTTYVTLAQEVLAGNLWLGPGVYYVSPLYIYFLAAILAFTDSYTAVRGAQILLGTASVGLIYLTARRWFGGRAGLAAAALAALTGLFTFYEVLILQASIDAFLTSAAVYALAAGLTDLRSGHADLPPERGRHAPRAPVAPAFSRKHLLIAGVIFGIQTLNRPNVMIAALGVAAVMLIVTRRAGPAALLVAGVLAGMAPAAIRNGVVARQWSFVSSHGGLNFYIGNSGHATGFYTFVPGITPTIAGQESDARRVAAKALGRDVTDAEASAYFFSLARRWMAEHPGDAVALFARKLYYTFNAAHVPLPHSYIFYTRDVTSLLPALLVGPWLLVPLGLAGLLFARPLRGGFLIWSSFVPAYAAAVALFFVAERYRLPLLVPLCAGAGAAIDLAWRAAGAGRARALMKPAAAFAVLAIAANWPLRLNDGRWDEGLRLAQQLVIHERYDEAREWAERLDGRGGTSPGAAHYGVGAQLLALEKADLALPYLETAYAANPHEPRVEYALGRALLKRGRARDAVPHLRRGFEAGIELPSGGIDFPMALQETGDVAGAAAAVARITPAETDDVEAWLRLGRLASQVRAPATAERFFRRAAELRPGLAAARQQYGLNLLVLGRADEAFRELSEAVRLDPRNADSLSALAFAEVRLGRPADARAHAAAALAINPDDRLARGILRGGGS
jgi:tetratricopeptide (TPR) repeat protein